MLSADYRCRMIAGAEQGAAHKVDCSGRIVAELSTGQNALQWGVPPNPVEASGLMMNS